MSQGKSPALRKVEDRVDESADWVALGVIGGAKGLDGSVRITSYTADPADIAAYGPVYDRPGGRPLPLRVRQTAKGTVIATIDGVTDRDAATRLNGTRLYVPRSALPAPAEEEFYHCDLIGLRVERQDGGALGTVGAVFDAGAGDVIEIIDENGVPTILLPFTRSVVPGVDIAGGRLIVDPPEGLA